MNNKFDELAKGMAQSVTRRQAVKRFGVGLAGMVLACFGLANKADAAKVCLPGGHACGNAGWLACLLSWLRMQADLLFGGILLRVQVSDWLSQ